MKFFLLTLLFFLITRAKEQRPCSKIAKTEQYVEPKDPAWLEYVASIYGENAPVEKDDVNFLYKHGKVLAKAYNWDLLRPLSALPFHWGDAYFRHAQYDGMKFAPNEWIEVSRYSTSFLKTFKKSKKVWYEGYSTGFPGRSENSTKVAYGCWFQIAQGSGIYVNIGNTLVVQNKYKGGEMFKTLGLTSKGCLKGGNSENKKKCYDRYVCTAALAHGYNSVVILGESSLVVCRGSCVTKTLKDACPHNDIELRSGYGASRTCNCSDDAVMLNCGADNKVSGSFRKRATPSTDSLPPPITCIGRNPKTVKGIKKEVVPTSGVTSPTTFKFTIGFTAGILQHYRRTLPKINSLLAQQHRQRAADKRSNPRVLSDPDHLVLLDVGDSYPLHHGRSFATATNSTGSGSTTSQNDNDTEELIFKRLSDSGYKAIGMDSSYFPLTAEQGIASLPILSLNVPGFQRSTIVKVGTVTIGVLAYTNTHHTYFGQSRNDALLTARIIEESLCLRAAGADVVVMLGGGDSAVKQHFAHDTKGYIDVFLGSNATSSRTCNGDWYTTQGLANIADIDMTTNQLGYVTIYKDNGGIKIRSGVLPL